MSGPQGNPSEDDRLGNEPAHPVADCSTCQYAGLTKRELFAAMAMQGAMAGLGATAHLIEPADRPIDQDVIAIDAVKMADALLRELAHE